MEKQIMKERRKAKENRHASISVPQVGTHSPKAFDIPLPPENRRTTAAILTKGAPCKINWYHPALRSAFPGNHKMWSVDRLFNVPIEGQGGKTTNVELFIDEPRLPYKIREAKMKLDVLSKLGIRFLILKDGVTPLNQCDGFVDEDEVEENEHMSPPKIEVKK